MVLRSVLVGSVFAIGAASASAQNVSGVFSPEVDPDDHEAEFRIGLSPNDQDDWRYNARLHYQRALNESVRLRGIIQYTQPANGDWELRFIQGELLWQIVEETPSGYASGLRFDARLAEGDNTPHQIGVNWTNQWELDNGWRVRAIGLIDVDAGPGARDGVFLEARSSLTRRVGDGYRIGLETFNDLGNSEQDFTGQEHSIGPVISGPLVDGFSWHAGVQFGATDDANDHDWQFRLTKEF